MSFFPSCQEVQTELTEYADGSLPVRRRVGIWIHLQLCKACARFLRGMKALLAPPTVAPEAAARALASVQVAIRKRG